MIKIITLLPPDGQSAAGGFGGFGQTQPAGGFGQPAAAPAFGAAGFGQPAANTFGGGGFGPSQYACSIQVGVSVSRVLARVCEHGRAVPWRRVTVDEHQAACMLTTTWRASVCSTR